MNERIKEIFDRSNEESIADWKKGIRYQTSYEKFAELIVRECADIFGREGTGEYQVDGNWIAKTIKQHFGVGE